MDEHISRDKAEKIIADVINRGGTVAEILTEIHYLPAADVVEVRHGSWEFTEDVNMPWCTKAVCTSCGVTIADNVDLSQSFGRKEFIRNNRYCPNCGAKMDGGRNE